MIQRASATAALVAICLTTSFCHAAPQDEQQPDFASRLVGEIEEIERASPGTLGVFAKKTDSPDDVRYHADRHWYLASTVKVPVAIVLLQKVERGELKLETSIVLKSSDFVDGSGEVQTKAPGSRISVGYLLKKMLTQSDSTAADLLIRLVGEEDLNGALADMAGEGAFGPVTTLLQVRQDAYGELHPKGRELTNLDFIEINRIKDRKERLKAFMKKTGVSEKDLKADSIEEAFERYYARGKNSGSLAAFGQLLERLQEGALLSPAHTKLVLGHMRAMTTGETRIKSGLPDGVSFAQKTGTQIDRICNVGIIGTPKDGDLVIAACAEKFPAQSEAERMLGRVGEVVMASPWRSQKGKNQLSNGL
jgi:beta-lactamase class A